MSFLKSLGIGIDRPPYVVMQKLAENIEIRKYGAAKWVCTKAAGPAGSYSNYRSGMFNKLFKYISGQNSANQKIAMTSPVTTDYKVYDNQLMTPQSNVEIAMRFYVAKDQEANVPVPTGDAYVVQDPEMIVAVVQFGGYASTQDFLNYRNVLINSLGSEANNYDLVNIMTAGYDPPFKPVGRTNEVWLRRIR